MKLAATLGGYPAIHRLRLLSRYLRGSAVCPGLPPTVVIANTHSCNHFCRMCIREAVANIRRFLDRKRARRASTMVTLQMVCLQQTLHQVNEFYRMWRNVSGVNSVRVKKDDMAIERVEPGELTPRARRRNACARLW